MLLGTLRLHEAADPEAVLTTAARLGLGVDTADVYGDAPHQIESMLTAFSGEIVSKGGLVRSRSAWTPDGRAKHLITTAEASAQALGSIQLYLLHTVDPRVPLGRSWRALEKLQKRGVVEAIGLSNPTLAHLREVLESAVKPTAIQVQLSAFHLDPLRDGRVRIALETGLRVLAHSPLGGWRRKRRVPREIAAIADAHGVSGERLTLRWLESLGVEPVVGCTRPSTVEDAAGPVPAEAIEAVRAELPTGELATKRPRASGRREIVLVLGLPASGKTTHALGRMEAGTVRVNRDALGGTLRGVVRAIDDTLDRGTPRVVSDNTWPTRALRNRVVQSADARDAHVVCEWMPTSFAQCQRQAVHRIWDHLKRLPQPEELKAGKDPWCFGPDALFRIRERFEPPEADEGFSTIRRLQPPTEARGTRAGFVVGLAALEQRTELPRPLFVAGWAPDSGRRARLEQAIARHEVEGTVLCTHPPGPARCWCRKPLPGMGVHLVRTYDLAPEHTVVIGGAVESAFAEACGFGFEAI